MTSRAHATIASWTLVAAATVVSAQAPGDWKPLFNGTDLTGWSDRAIA